MKKLLCRMVVFVVAAAVCVAGARWVNQKFLRAIYPLEYEDIVEKYATEYGLQASLVYGVIQTESHFKPDAQSPVGAKGLMQLMDATYEWVQTRIAGDPEPAERVFDPEVNIRCGCKVLQIVLKEFEVTETALAAYNAGSGNVSKWLKNTEYSDDGVTLKYIPVEETRNYVKRVLKAQKMYQTIYGIDKEDV